MSGLGVVLLGDVASIAVLGAVALLLRRRSTRPDRSTVDEHELWTWLFRATGVVVLGLVAATAVQGWSSQASSAVLGLALVVEGPLVQQGLMRWNRDQGPEAGPGDLFNGVGATVALAAVINLALSWSGSPLAALPWWLLQSHVLGIATTLVLLGTTATLARIAGLQRDVRLWCMAGAFAIASAAQSAHLLAGATDGTLPILLGGLALAGALLATSALLPANPGPRGTARAHVTAAGTAVVLLAAVAILVVESIRVRMGWVGGADAPKGTYATILFSVLAVLAAGARVLQLVDELALLATSRLEARTDELTGLANRRALMARLSAARESNECGSILVLDLDRFKEVNDRYGHATGDALLQLAAKRLAPLVPPDGLIARLGGDEFAVVLAGTETEAIELGHRLAAAAREIVEVDGRPVRCSVSIGAATGSALLGCDELLSRADSAMYRAKASGTEICLHDEQVDHADRARAALVEELRAALDPAHPDRRSQFVVHYQPQLDLRTGHVTGVEALVRWQHPVHGLLAPGAFVDLVEQYGLMKQMTVHVLGTAAELAAAWQARGWRLRVAVNLSASLLEGEELLPMLDDVVRSTGVDPTLLVLEVTETTLMIDPKQDLTTARAVAARGFGLSIDDYGTGYSSLAYLNDLPVDELKLDRSFVARVLTDPRTVDIVAATVGLAHRLGLRLVAEGVEDEATFALLRELGCDESQGYLHSRPQPVEALEDWLHAQPGRLAPHHDLTN